MIQTLQLWKERRSIFVELEVQGNDLHINVENFNYTIEEEDSPIIKTLYKKLEELGVDMSVEYVLLKTWW